MGGGAWGWISWLWTQGATGDAPEAPATQQPNIIYRANIDRTANQLNSGTIHRLEG